MRGRLLKAARWALWLWLAWLLAGNLVLNTALGPALVNRTPERFQLHWRAGLTLWPAHVWLWDVRARGQVRRQAWQAQAERASGRIALFPLLARTLHLAGVRAQGVDVHLDRAGADLPPPPYRPGGWWVVVEAGTDSLRSLGHGHWRLRGRGGGELAVRKQLHGGPLAVPRVILRLQDGALHGDAQLWAAGIELAGRFSLPKHPSADAPGLERLRLADAHLRLQGRTPGLVLGMAGDGQWAVDFTRLPLQPPAGDAQGVLRADLALDRGELRSGSTLDLTLPLEAVDAGGRQHSEQARLHLTVEDGRLRLAAHLPPPPGDIGQGHADLYLDGRALPLPQAGSWEAQLPRLSGEVALDWQFDSLHWLAPLFARARWLALEGAGRVQAALRLEAGALAAGSTLDVPQVTARIDVLDNRFSGSARAHGRIEEDGGGTRSRLELHIREFRMTPVSAPDEVGVAGRDLRLTATAAGRLADVDRTLQARLRFSDARIPDLRHYNRYLPRAGLRFLGGEGRLSGDLHLDAGGEVAQGSLGFEAHGARLALGGLDLGGNLQLRTQLRRGDLAARRFVLDGSQVELTGLHRTGQARARDRGWWARATLTRGEVRWGRPLRVNADVEARARDVGLLLALFAHEKDYPRWVFNLVDAGEAQLDTRVRLGGRAMTLDPLHARNERFDVKARLRIAGREPVGDLLLAWGRLSLGLALADGQRDWQLRRAAEWFAGRRLPD